MTDHTEQRISRRLLQLRGGTDLIVRADGHLQFGTVPEVARILTVPPGVAVEQIHQVMRELRRRMTRPAVIRMLGHCGVPPVHARGIVDELTDAGFLLTCPAGFATHVHVLGSPAHSRALLHHLRDLRIPASGLAPGTPTFGRLGADDLVVLAGILFPPAELSYRLMDLGVTHLTCGVVDARITVGPVVVPGVTGCLSCLDAEYQSADARWRSVRHVVTGCAAPPEEQMVEMTATVTAGIVRDMLCRRETDPQGDTWVIPDAVRGRRYLDPLTLITTETVLPRKPGCPSCSLAPGAR